MRLILICVGLVEVCASPAFAHTGVGQTYSFASGWLHPFGGADHVIAMASVGIWGVIAGGRAIWIWPATFMAAMLAGFAAAILGLQISFVEPAIATSIVVLGLLVVLGVKAPLGVGTATVGFFAFFHGHAHGAEAGAVTLLPYLAGFALATALLQAARIGVGLCVRSLAGKIAFPYARPVSGASQRHFEGGLT